MDVAVRTGRLKIHTTFCVDN